MGAAFGSGCVVINKWVDGDAPDKQEIHRPVVMTGGNIGPGGVVINQWTASRGQQRHGLTRTDAVTGKIIGTLESPRTSPLIITGNLEFGTSTHVLTFTQASTVSEFLVEAGKTVSLNGYVVTGAADHETLAEVRDGKVFVNGVPVVAAAKRPRPEDETVEVPAAKKARVDALPSNDEKETK
jgi:hypothetical protein